VTVTGKELSAAGVPVVHALPADIEIRSDK
jgi:hypothetical protein